MPHRRKKPFIEKKKAVTFHLVHRSQKDPLVADETAPQRVLLPAEKTETEKRREEQRQFGVFFDDDYDYLQHLKEALGPSELVPATAPHQQSPSVDAEEEIVQILAPSINLPSSVFASEFEENVGLLNKAAPVRGPRLDLDPDIVAALDDDFNYEDPDNLLEDDFIVKATGSAEEGLSWRDRADSDNEWEDVNDGEEEGDGSSKGEDYDSEGPLSDEEGESVFRRADGSVKEFLFLQEETKSRFTEYSLTSSVMRRNEQLSLLDERFEKFYEQFDDDEIGALDNVELEGFIHPDSIRLQEVIEDFYKQKAKDCVKLDDLEPRDDPNSFLNEDDEAEEKEDLEKLVIEEPRATWDCQSILSTYSNLYNHPQLIKEPPKPKAIKVSAKTGIPLGVLPERGLTAKQAERMQRINDSDLPRASTQTRSKNESKEERKTRKQTIREERKERRFEKKANKLAFKMEKARQEKEQLNLRQNIQNLKLS
ncbi:protein LTV1 homolog [Microcaecilia unicolor]|uniref:Protein LTV1 homolog n=1 Tax=Microcaecilia unicolor TaxID=1415580 RepID=A0A6P7XDS4_9AMPH|nr:protein LTV1 homolog [Microcaecilia unicolor]